MLRLGVVLALIATAYSQWTAGGFGRNNFGMSPFGNGFSNGFANGFGNGFGNRFGGGFGNGFFGRGFPAIGFNGQGASGFANPAFSGVSPAVGLDSFFSSRQGQPVFASTLGYDTSDSRAEFCNGPRDNQGKCMCVVPYYGASCTVRVSDVGLSSTPGARCVQTPSEDDLRGVTQARYAASSRAEQLKMELQFMMSGNRNTGPGFGRGICANVPNGGPMSPRLLKSAFTDYGYIICTEEQTCKNMVCSAGSQFSPDAQGCEGVMNPEMRGIPNLNAPGLVGPAKAAAVVTWHEAVLRRPKISAEPNAGPVNPNGVAVGQGFPANVGMNAPYNPPFYGRG